MKITKIEIKKTILDIDVQGKSTYREMLMPVPQNAKYGDMIESYSMVENTKDYQLREMYFTPTNKEWYAIPIDDRKLFDDLFHLAQDMYQEALYKQETRLEAKWYAKLEMDVESAKAETAQSIKRLSWWKRLFKKF